MLYLLSTILLFSVVHGENTFTCHTGTPPGYSDLCSGTLIDCANGWVQHNSTILQWSRKVMNTGSGDQSAGRATIQALKKCMNSEKMCNVMQKVASKNFISGLPTACSFSSNQWHNTQYQFNFDNIPVLMCPLFKNEFVMSSGQCQSVKTTLEAGLIVLIVILSLLGSVCFCVAGFYCYRKNCIGSGSYYSSL